MSRVRVDRTQGATFVELFFDLVFVYAVTQLTSFVLHDLTWSGVGKAGLLFWLVWWAWTQFTWTLNLADTEHVWVRLPTLVATGVAFFLAQAVPDAYGDAGAWFAVSYALVRLIGLGVQAWVIGQDQKRSLTTWATASMLGIALVLVGGFVAPELRIWFWMAAFAADLFSAGLAGRDVWVLEPGHFAERHGLIVIIALGESLIAAGVASAEIERGLLFAATTAGAVVATCALWWTYFGTLHARFEERFADQGDATRGRFARDVFSFWHAGIVAGVIGVAVAFEEAIAHPQEPLTQGAALALTIGVALYVGGLGAASARAGIRDGVIIRFGVALGALVLTPLIPNVAGWVSLWALAIVVIAMDVLDGRTQDL
ncbi:MAG TPA: low temperature requirement protein A [Acidimicrobiia bacterium]|nr:low temperature requirement protein A [Acidimicrobiia bacterium]